MGKSKFDNVSGDYLVSHLICRFKRGRIDRVLFPHFNTEYVDHTLYGDFCASVVFQINWKTRTFYETKLKYWAFKKALYKGNLYVIAPDGFLNLLTNQILPYLEDNNNVD